MTYASPVFAHAALKALNSLQVIKNKFCRVATDTHWCVRNSVLHRDLELLTIAIYIKDVSKSFFDIAESHPNAPLHSAASYEAQPYHLNRRPRSVFIDPPDALTAKVVWRFLCRERKTPIGSIERAIDVDQSDDNVRYTTIVLHESWNTPPFFRYILELEQQACYCTPAVLQQIRQHPI
ncbi:Probable RNA-directed DNA polymerase from transposon X-element [Eumeta japonica]|uniref:Probable RNA-directed DNA polymerase from transposon X-element n=1 Tax=Eumeta variegata TaxID=151549 RepID=A0A4C1V1A0_EUMVA|nr:Probable RNA-directed DNA polymerase from transposon X-element [Eumeta japonica]